MSLLATVFAILAGLGLVQCFAGWALVRQFVATPARAPRLLPPVTILRPLCGDEPLLAEALASCCRQHYPHFQILFGVQDAGDPALAVVQSAKRIFPELDITVIIDATMHGPNRKVSNLINMLPFARYDLLVFSDSDLHLPPDYLAHLVAALEKPNVGLVSTLCVAWSAGKGWAAPLGACQVKYNFLPGALLARALGRQDCLGSTMALRRRTLERSGGLEALVGHLADDNILGRRVAALGHGVGIADTVVAATAPEPTLTALWQHEMRWARTIRAVAPILFGLSAIQYPCFWALLACLAAREAEPSLVLLGLAATVRAGTAWGIDRALEPKLALVGSVPAVPHRLLVFRDFFSIIEIIASYFSKRVVWRGIVMESRRWKGGRSTWSRCRDDKRSDDGEAQA
jgi:ceramide glucosyltransferase